jgi:hypothetical protein
MMGYDEVDPMQIDAHAFVDLSRGLRDALARVVAADLPSGQRARWQHRLAAITDAARRDVATATDQLARFEADWARIHP